ncbi:MULTISPECIES: YjcG family protein [unclassified Bacillus (in: firmicutes)]|uniref:YjcG family protein n=1 Tax=unclassified Bacillus (in: firmicutes) TaxID=185979 RepID=UPI0008E6CDA9|nr:MULTISPECIES: YjcG family protein [unclassified Bacillus (in: firmicutes)]SFA78219.1 2'-5' RNA ligase [Bacillus sp. UNCCL13]SFQ68141.1 2'-5' RNA ligase [Bacillus sp. cl95]
MKFGVVIFPSKKLQDLANSYRKRYDPHYSLITPHLTLKSAFEATEDEAKKLAEQLGEIAKKYQPFQLKTTKISSFQPVNNVIYLKVEPSEYLDSLHNDMNAQLETQPQEYAFVPHITIAQKLSNDEHSDVYGSLRMLDVNHEETVDRFHLLYQLENGSWTVYETFRLRKE